MVQHADIDHTGITGAGSYPTPTTVYLGADVNITPNTFATGPSATGLADGTYECDGVVTVTPATGAANFTVKLWDGTTVTSGVEHTVNTTWYAAIPISGTVVLTGGVGILRISVTCDGGSAPKIKAAPVDNATGIGNKASWIRYKRIA